MITMMMMMMMFTNIICVWETNWILNWIMLLLLLGTIHNKKKNDSIIIIIMSIQCSAVRCCCCCFWTSDPFHEIWYYYSWSISIHHQMMMMMITGHTLHFYCHWPYCHIFHGKKNICHTPLFLNKMLCYVLMLTYLFTSTNKLTTWLLVFL